MSSAAVRVIAGLLGLLGFGLRLMTMFWIQPLTWRIEPTVAGIGAALAAILLSVAAPFVLYLVLVVPHVPRRAVTMLGIDSRRHRFVAEATPHIAAPMAMVLMTLGATMIVTERVPGEDRMRLAQLDFVLPISIVAVAVCFTAAIVLLVLRGPRLILRPTGLTLQKVTNSATISWDELAPGGPAYLASVKPRWVAVHRVDPLTPTRTLVWQVVPIGWLNVDPSFLTAAIRWYVAHPEDRPAIGSEAELTRLRTALAEPSVPIGA